MKNIQLQDYQIHIGNPKAAFAALLDKGKYTKVGVLADMNTAELCLDVWRNLTGVQEDAFWVIPAGEKHKTVVTCANIWQNMLDSRFDRHALIVNLGGGVIGDMGGFCAATYMRGIDFVQVPTTLLSQVDAAIGGKLGVDFGGVKNSVGLFAQPKGVFLCTDFLSTLPNRELRSGFAEMLKHALIYDAAEWNNLKALNLTDVSNWESLIARSLAVKRHFVEADPFERGIRKALNFGHTIGHAVESVALETDAPLLHGEAIGIGMICEAYLSHLLLGMTQEELNDIIDAVSRLYPKYIIDPNDYDKCINLMRLDKKNSHEKVLCTLLPKLGQVVVNQDVNEQLLHECLVFYTAL